MSIFRVKMFGYDSPRTTLMVLEEDLNVVHEAAKTAVIDDPNDAQ